MPPPWVAVLLLKVHLEIVGLLPLMLAIPPPTARIPPRDWLLVKVQSEMVGLLPVLSIPAPLMLLRIPPWMVNPLMWEARVREVVFKHRPPGPPLALEGSRML